MRLDKFLKLSRLIKRRTVAKEVAEAGRVLLNGRPAKPAGEVRPGDRLEIRFGARRLVVEVLLVPTGKAPPADTLYRVLADEREVPGSGRHTGDDDDPS